MDSSGYCRETTKFRVFVFFNRIMFLWRHSKTQHSKTPSVFHWLQLVVVSLWSVQCCLLLQGVAVGRLVHDNWIHSAALLLIGSGQILKENNPSPQGPRLTRAQPYDVTPSRPWRRRLAATAGLLSCLYRSSVSNGCQLKVPVGFEVNYSVWR